MTGERVFLGVTLILGAWVRLSGLDLGWFLQDQVRDGTIALEILSGQNFPLVGPLAASGTFKLGPLFYYLLAIPYGWSANPAVGVAFLNVLNLLSIYLTYRLGTEMFGSPVGLVAAALYAVFPMAVLSGKALWNPGFIPVFTTLFLLTLWRFLVGRRPWVLALVLLFLGVLLQIHMSGAIFAVLLPVILLLYRSSLPRWPLLTGLLGVALLYAPYLLFEFQHGFPDALGLLSLAGTHVWNPEGQSFWLIAGRGLWIPFALPERMAAALPEGAPSLLFPVAQRIELVLFGLGLLALGTLLVKARDRSPYLLLALWLALPFAIFPHKKIGVLWYYFDILYPAQFLVIGLLTRIFPDLWPEIRSAWLDQHRLRLALSVLVSALVALQVWFILGFEAAVRRSGILRFTTDIVLSFPDPGWNVKTQTLLDTMPLRFKMALADKFVSEFGADHDTLERRAHGGVYQQFREDKGFSFLTVSPLRPQSRPDSSRHYLILRKDARVALEQGPEVSVGPYRIVAYHPTVRYESWRWSASPGREWWSQGFDDSAWTPLTLPARKPLDRSVYGPLPYTRWPEKLVAFRGWTEVPSVGRPFWLVLNIRDDYLFPHEVETLYVNGQPIEAARTISYNTVETRNIEIIADVTSALRPGSNLVAFQITGLNKEFDVDLYELRPAVRPMGS